MPKYQNDSSANIKIIDENSREKILIPGDISLTNKYYDIPDLTKLDDEPFINPIEAYHVETFASAETRTLVLSSPDITKIRVQKVTGIIDIYLQSITNTPAILVGWTADDYPVDIIITGRADQIIIDSKNPTGSVQIMEIKER